MNMLKAVAATVCFVKILEKKQCNLFQNTLEI